MNFFHRISLSFPSKTFINNSCDRGGKKQIVFIKRSYFTKIYAKMFPLENNNHWWLLIFITYQSKTMCKQIAFIHGMSNVYITEARRSFNLYFIAHALHD